MKNFKRVLLTLVAALLVFAMCFAMVGCDKDEDKDDKDDDSKTSVSDKKETDKDEEKETKAEKADDEDDDIDFSVNPSSGNGKATAEELADAVITAMFENCDGQELVDLLYDGFVDYIEDNSDQREEDLVDTLQLAIDSYAEVVDEYGDTVEIDWEVESVTDLDDAAFETTKTGYSNADIDIESVKMVEVVITISASTNSSISQDITFNVPAVEIDGEWYLDAANMDKFVG